MNSRIGSIYQIRDQGVQLLQKGKEKFDNKDDLDSMEDGYCFYKKGIEYLITYLKSETNPDIVEKAKETLSVWIAEAKSMETELDEARRKPPKKRSPSPFKSESTTPIRDRSPNQQSQRDRTPPRKNDTSQLRPKQRDGDMTRMMDNLESAIVTEKPNIRWNDIAGLEQAKKALQEAVIYPIKFPNLFEGMRTPWKGILLYGPPGTGKTYLAKACATEADATFYSVSSADITSKYIGESEKLIKTLFQMARANKPAIIFIDEIDSLLSARSDNENEASRRVKTEFLVQMQGVGNDDTGILVLGATNIPWALDSAVRRRFEKRIYIPLPDNAARVALLRKQLSTTPNNLQDDDIIYIAGRTEGFSCADMNILIRDASYQPLRMAQNATHFKITGTLASGQPIYMPCAPSDSEGQRMKMLDITGDQLTLADLTLDDFEVSMLKTKPSVNQNDLVKQQQFTKEFGMEG